jgi:hypothetical protein
MIRACLIVTLLVQSFAAEKSTFALWTRSAIDQQQNALMKNVAPDHSSRETLADYGAHRFRLLYRDGDGLPEEHDRIVDVVMVHSGEATLILGGTMKEKKGSAATRRICWNRDHWRRDVSSCGGRYRSHSSSYPAQLPSGGRQTHHIRSTEIPRKRAVN